MSTRVAVVVAVIVVVVFIVVLALGGQQPDGSPTDSNALIDRLADRAGDSAAVPLDSIAAECFDDDDEAGTLLVFGGALGGSCRLVVEHDGDLGLVRLFARTDFGIDAPAPDGDVEVEADAESGEEVSVAVGEGTTVIALTCPGSGECEVRLVE